MSRQRHKGACKDLCCSRFRAVESKLPKARVLLEEWRMVSEIIGPMAFFDLKNHMMENLNCNSHALGEE